MFGTGGRSSVSKSRGRSKSIKQRSPTQSPLPVYNDPRQQIFEAKFEKYLANKKAKEDHDAKRKSMAKAGFDRYTKMTGSPSKHAGRAQMKADPLTLSFSGRYNPNDLMPANLDEEELRKQ